MSIFVTYFSNSQLFLLIVGCLIHLFCIYSYSYKNNIKIALFLLLLGGIILRIMMIYSDDFLHPWDEQFHALIAKNITEKSLIPTLYHSTPLTFDPNSWTENHVWLHKQPLFLWQMALSLKLFGITTYAVRIPSLIMSIILILVIFRMGKLVVNENVGFLACFIYATNNYFLDFISGQYNTDHNDIAFLFYVTLSVWSFLEYQYSSKKKYIYLIGVFVGAAVLNKWLVGLLAYSGWGISLFYISEFKNKLIELKNIVISFLICVLIVLPWQIYAFLSFPELYLHELNYSTLHISEVIEEHSGSVWFHFEQTLNQYGYLAAYLLPIALWLLFFEIKNIRVRVALIVYVIIVFTFFTIAKTKMPAFCIVVSSILFLALGNFVHRSYTLVTKKISSKYSSSIMFLGLILIFFFNINIEKIQSHHTSQGSDKIAWYRNLVSTSATLAKSINNKFQNQKTIVFNCSIEEYIQIMFYSNCLAYKRIPTNEEINLLKNQGYKIVYLRTFSDVPDFINNDSNIIFINNIGKKEIDNFSATLIWDNKYLCSDGFINNELFFNRKVAGKWEKFKVFTFEDNLAVISCYNNLFLSCRIDGKKDIISNKTGIGTWEIFKIIMLDDDFVAFKASNGKYWSVNPKTLQVFATADEIGENERFKIQKIN